MTDNRFIDALILGAINFVITFVAGTVAHYFLWGKYGMDIVLVLSLGCATGGFLFGMTKHWSPGTEQAT